MDRGDILIPITLADTPQSRRIRHDPRRWHGKKIGRQVTGYSKSHVTHPNGFGSISGGLSAPGSNSAANT